MRRGILTSALHSGCVDLGDQCVLPSRFPRLWHSEKFLLPWNLCSGWVCPCVLGGGLQHPPHFILLVNMFTGKESKSSIDGVESYVAVGANSNRVPTTRPAETAG